MDLESLYISARKGNSGAEKQLFEALLVRFRLIAHHRIRNDDTADEAVQEALAVVAREYRDTAIHTSFAAWACKVLDNRILASLRAAQVERKRAVADPAGYPVVADGDISPAVKRRLMNCLEKVGRMNRRYSRILNLRHQGYGTEEICRRLGISAGNCYVLLARARKMLEACLKKGSV